ncbi:homocysteine S-methyltransferase family protein [Vibrio sp. ZSDE26]|uniref:Homocysteine S-methyltransferase family protein n=1 Tax=Vibrio amylolyticus TaxID=2847292 RepID=A0A9X1XM86_9VIBR|nr:homocysteine S-methyltransferase family protein [Vibrio amylolyticus]MCK6265842.1 homocysteine S-methyltransferase family protein [Vibrio amylolyticus]
MFTLLDGGMGRELKRMGAPFSQPLWSAQALIESPQHVKQAHQRFIDAGCDVITVNSYACVPFHLGNERFETQGKALATIAAKLAQEVAISNSNVKVAGALPPALGSYRPDLFNREQAKPILEALIEAQSPFVDLWIVETISSIEEFNLVSTLLSNTDKPVYYAFTLKDSLESPAQLRSGEEIEKVAEAVFTSNAKALLFNCSRPEVMGNAILNSRKVFKQNQANIELGAYANGFTPIEDDHLANDGLSAIRDDLSPVQYLEFAKQWLESGASIIGGCCGIHPEHISELNQFRGEANNH